MIQEFFTPLLNVFRPVNRERESRGSSFVQDVAISEIFTREDRYKDIVLPLTGQFIKLMGRDIEISALKVNEDRHSIIIRFYNSSSEYREADILLDRNICCAYLTDLMEKRICSLGVENYGIKAICFKPKEIVTIEIVSA